MQLEIITKFETSHTGNNATKIQVRILTDAGIEICKGEDKDSWPDSKESPASAKRATKDAISKMEHMLENVILVAKKASLI